MKNSADNNLQDAGMENKALYPKTTFITCVFISIFHIYFNNFAILPSLLQNSLHYAGFVFAATLIYPLTGTRKKPTKFSFLNIINILIGSLTSFAAVFMVVRESSIYEHGLHLNNYEWAFGIILIISALEFTRRTSGPLIPILIILALSYVGWWGKYVPGVFNFSGLSVETLLFRSIYGDDGIFGSIATISSSYVFMFILLGAFLLKSGAGDFIVNIAKAVAGRLCGGAGIIAVIASGLTGTISGSAVANTASTGVITIPLMKKAGFPARFAAAVEATASTGGQLMPPIMGAGAFIMASYTQLPYTTIIKVSLLPAILFFLSICFFIRVEAKRSECSMDENDSVKLSDAFKENGLPFLLTVSVLVGLLIFGFTPTYSAGIAIVVTVVSTWLTPKKMGITTICEALALGAKNMVMTAILLCSVGLIINVLATSGVGNTFSHMIVEWAGSNMLIAILLVALASLVLGMGLPVTASYIVLGTLSAPALYNIMANGQLVQAVADGQIAEHTKMILSLSLSPEIFQKLGEVMSLDSARMIVDSLPPEIVSMLREQMLSPEALSLCLLSAHMIIFWLSQDSNVTPPVCLTAFTAAAIANSPPMATGLTSWKLAKGLYVMPILFAYTNFIGGPWDEVISIFIFSLFGIYALVGFLEGFLEASLGLVSRVILGGAALALLWPTGMLVHLVGLATLLIIFTTNWRSSRDPETGSVVDSPIRATYSK